MNLLPPKKLNEKIQDQKGEQVKAGLFLAKKIDSVREELLTLEKERDEFIAGSKKVITEGLRNLHQEKDSIVKEINDRRLELIELRKPLDGEWKKVTELDKQNKEKETLLDRKSENLFSQEKEINENQIAIDKRLENVSYLEKEIEKSLIDSVNKTNTAKKILSDAQVHKKETGIDIDLRIKELAVKENTIAYREIDVENKFKIIVSKEELIEKEKKHIEAQRRALTAAFAELEKKKNG